MNGKWKNVMLICAFGLLIQVLSLKISPQVKGEIPMDALPPYTLELSKWGIFNDGTHPVETTQGINKALIWAVSNNIKAVTLPDGTYLIDKDNRIEMVSNLKWELSSGTTLVKESNNKERYDLLYLGPQVRNVALSGGKYVGDKDTHDYGKKGTHEFGYGIIMEGASDVVVDGVQVSGFTGDGLMLGGYGQMIRDIYEKGFVSGGIDQHGKPIVSKTKIRTKTSISLSDPLFSHGRTFELSNMMKLTRGFELDFYKSDGSFLTKVYAQARQEIEIPTGAASFHLVFNQASAKSAYLEIWYRKQTSNVVVQNSEFSFNRRQGITVGGADQVLIQNSIFHDIKGTAPEAGIDVEGGYDVNGFLNTNVTIRKNEFYNNKSFDIVLYDGRGAIVADNHLASEGKVGLIVSAPFTGAEILNNHFDKTSLNVTHDTTLQYNRMNGGTATFIGPRVVLRDMVFTDSKLALNAKVAFGIEVANITMDNNKQWDTGLSVWGKAVKVTNLNISGEGTLRSVVGGGEGGSIFENLQVLGYNSAYGLQLPVGTYRNSRFVPSETSKNGTVSALLAGNYVFDGSYFATNKLGAGGVYIEQETANVAIKNSTFEVQGNATAVDIQSARSVSIRNNEVKALSQTQNGVELIRISTYWKREAVAKVLNAVISGNSISSNLQAYGISLQYAGLGAPVYRVEDNTLVKAKILLKENDINQNNKLTP
ncbi:right-handed parallel beta-helix repeat-containing protein [Paenibacillus sp. sgz500958]|uniref:right-handed parallel beta-helix repeat-containing protein n=1 Tax=Paenibacillus sp. sgz500958 TaxID=3242475 RepID=UPI0036D239F3